MENNKDRDMYRDFSNVETMRMYTVPNHMPEGPYGCPIGADEPVGNKQQTPWSDRQRPYSAFNYEFKNLHQDIPRQDPGSHPVHADSDVNEEMPYTTHEVSHKK